MLRLAARGHVPDFVLDEAQARLLQRGGRRVARRRAAARWSTELLLDPTPPTRAVRRPRRGASGPWPSGAPAAPATRTLLLALIMLELWLGEYLPRAFARREPERVGRVTAAALRGRHAGAQRGEQPPRLARRARGADAAARASGSWSTTAPPTPRRRSLAELAAAPRLGAPADRAAPRTAASAGRRAPRGARPRRLPRSASRALHRAGRRGRQGRRRHRLRARLLRAR